MTVLAITVPIYLTDPSLPGRCVSVGALVLNEGATNVVSTLVELKSHFQTNEFPWNEQQFGYESRWGLTPRICWEEPAAIRHLARLCYVEDGG
jgi:hypothetical protein